MSNKLKISKKEISNIIKESADAFKGDNLEKHIGADEDRKIEYPDLTDTVGANDEEKPSSFEGGLETGAGMEGEELTKRMKSSPSQLLEFLDKLEEAKSVLSKVAAKETDQEVKSKIYSYYEKTQKVAFEMIKEFGIIH